MVVLHAANVFSLMPSAADAAASVSFKDISSIERLHVGDCIAYKVRSAARCGRCMYLHPTPLPPYWSRTFGHDMI